MDGITNGIKKYAEKKQISMHMPGHKSGLILPDQIRKMFGEQMFRYDLTEVPGTDNLQNPSGIIKETEEKIALATKAGAACILVNGSTAGLLAAIYHSAYQQEIFVASDCHQAVYNAVVLAQSWPIYISTSEEMSKNTGAGICPVIFKKAIRDFPDCKNLVITSPDYYGQRGDLAEIIAIAKAHQITVIVDEAHGAHLSMMDHYKHSAMDQGADLVIQSWHKTLPVLNQGSVLLLKDKRMQESVRMAVNLFQTTSPSYIIMATIDSAVSFYQQNAFKISDAAEKIIKIKKNFSFNNLSVFEGTDGVDDPFKLWIRSVKKMHPEADSILRKKYLIEPEIMNDDELLFLLPLLCTEPSLKKLFEALTVLDQQLDKKSEGVKAIPLFEKETIRKPARKPSELSRLKTEKVRVEEAAGRVCAQKVVAYPPGIPLIFPGELLTQEIICYLMDHKIHYNLTEGIYTVEDSGRSK